MKYGLILTAPTIQGQMDIARAADEAGFESVWTTEFFSQHGLVRLAAVATATTNIKLGTAIAYAFMRTPMLEIRSSASPVGTVSNPLPSTFVAPIQSSPSAFW